MLKKIFVIIATILILFSCKEMSRQPHEPTGKRIRDIVTDKYSDGSIIIGATIGQDSFGDTTQIILDEEFSYVTPENDFKQWMQQQSAGVQAEKKEFQKFQQITTCMQK